MIKRSIDVMHQKFMGQGIVINSNNEYFNVFIDKWWRTVNAKQKFSDFFYSVFITGNGIMELQYTPDGRIGNIEQIPMQTIWRVFRDQFANELKLVQVVDGVFKELDPQYFIHWMINNPDRQAFGKSEFHSAAAPRPIVSKVDSITGESINPDRTLRPLLDSQAILQNAEIEIKEKMGKPRLLVSAPGMPKDQMNEIQKEMADPNTDQYIWIFDKPIESSELQIQAQTKFDDYGNNVDAHIDIATGFASNVIKNPGSFSYSGGQTPMDVLDQRMTDLQIDASEMIKDVLLKPLAESWGFKEFNEMEVEIAFTPTTRKPTLEDIRLLDPEAISPKERRKMYEALNLPLDEQDFEEYQNEMKQDTQDQKEIQMTGAMMGNGADQTGGGFGQPPGDGEVPSEGKPSPIPSKSSGGQTKAPTTPQAGKPEAKPFESERPTPPRTDTRPDNPNKKKKGEVFTEEDVNNIAKRAAEEAVKLALERIPLPPKAGQNDNSSVDLYVSKGLDTPGKPELTDPRMREEYGLDDRNDEQMNELPPISDQKRADLDNQPDIQPEGGQYSPTGVKIPDQGMKNNTKQISPEEYYQELERAGDEQSGGDTNDRINSQSNGTFKDPFDLDSQTPAEPEVGNQNVPNPHPGVTDRQYDMVEEPNDKLYIDSGGSKADPPGKDQVLGSSDNDEQPLLPSEGDPKDNDEEEIKKATNLQQRGKQTEAVPKIQKAIQQGDDEIILPDAPEIQNRDNVKPEDRDPRLPFVDPDGKDNMEAKPQAQLDNTPLDYNSPETAEQTTTEDVHNLRNDVDGSGSGNAVDPSYEEPIGDSAQQRLREEEETGINPDMMMQNNSNFKLDNTNRNMKPDEQPSIEQGTSKMISEDDYMGEITKKENPLEKEGDLPEDGMIMKPEDIQQNDGVVRSGDDISLQSGGIDTIDPNASPGMGDNIDQGVDTEDIDPNILHYDPETGRNFTDLTDEQGNKVPDLRMDQTPESDEEQPEVELENPIVTKEEYEMEKESARGGMDDMMGGESPMISEDEFNAELDKKSTDPEAENPFDLDNKEEGVPTEGEEVPVTGASKPEEGSTTTDDKVAPKGDSEPKEKALPSSISEEPKEKEETGKNNTGGKKDSTEPESPEESQPKVDKKETGKNNTSGKEEKLDEEPDTELLERAKSLVESGMDENQINDTLIEIFGEDRVNKSKENPQEKEPQEEEPKKEKTKEVKKRRKRGKNK